MAANLVEKLQEAIKACEEITLKEVNEQKEEIEKQFDELKKEVYKIIDEKSIILSKYKWTYVKRDVNRLADLDAILNSEASKISTLTGYSKEAIKEVLIAKNKGKSYCCKGLFSDYYEYYTIDV